MNSHNLEYNRINLIFTGQTSGYSYYRKIITAGVQPFIPHAAVTDNIVSELLRYFPSINRGYLNINNLEHAIEEMLNYHKDQTGRFLKIALYHWE